MPNFLVRLSDDLYAALGERAYREERPKSKVLRDALSTHLGVPPQLQTPREGGQKKRGNAEEAKERDTVNSEPPFSCPVHNCDFQTLSDKAVCPRHGRRVRAQ